MKSTESLKKNHEFRRLYARGKSQVTSNLVVYCRRNRKSFNQLGLTVGTKVGKAVTRNLVRRRIKDAYRRNEENFAIGFDIVIVARTKSSYATYAELESDMLFLFKRLGLTTNRRSEK